MGDAIHFHNTSMALADLCLKVSQALSEDDNTINTFQGKMKSTNLEYYAVRQTLRSDQNSVLDVFSPPNDKWETEQVSFHYDSVARTLEVRIKVDLVRGEVDQYPPEIKK